MKLILKHLSKEQQDIFLTNILNAFIPDTKYPGLSIEERQKIVLKILDEINES